ncbi:hypothetical protein [Acinetobacter parvus]|uniref:hypothetical protein n=1 Tax=Acinetobacter parvus TaxID=134533 RepID=UPI0021D3AEF7|nr:hypothetical protein [Acinetobacter parvus]
MNLIDECLPTLVKNASLLSKKTILSNKDRNLILKELIEEIRNRSDQIIKVSEEDFEIAKQHTSDESLLNRLKFDKYKIDSCIKGLNLMWF